MSYDTVMALAAKSRKRSLNFVQAAFDGDLRKVKRLHRSGVDINFKNWADFTALTAASTVGRTGIINYLLRNNADMTGSLVGAACYNHFAAAELIIQEGRRRRCMDVIGIKKALWHTTNARGRPTPIASHIRKLVKEAEATCPPSSHLRRSTGRQ